MPAEAPKILLDRYVLQQTLQSGGMATVYRARDLITDELVAVKCFDRDRHLPEIEREAFWREVEALRNLTHPHIVRLRDFGEDSSGRFVVVLDLMKHDLVAEKEQGGQAFESWDDFADLVVLPLLDALSCAHESGIAHRDVKPANILVANDGTVRLADFSISKLKRTLQPRITLSEFMSPPFAPPERDSGEFSYARDVYSIGALCIWAMSSTQLHEHADLQRALPEAEFSVFPNVVEIIQRAISLKPPARQQSAPLLAAELGRVQAARKQHWIVSERPACSVGLTRTVCETLADELDIDSDSEIREFVSEDINADAAISRFVENFGQLTQRIRPQQFNVYGGAFRYHIAVSDRGHSAFTVVNAFRSDPDWLQKRRDESLPCPVRLVVDARTGVIPPTQAVDVLMTALDAFDAQQAIERHKSERTALFDTWQRVLQAKLQYERDRTKEIPFSDATIEGVYLTLETSADLSQCELGQPWVIESENGRRIRGEVWDTGPTSLVLNCAGALLNDVPESGVVRLDLYALRIAIDRQREAIDSIRAGTCARSNLREVLLRPFDLALPSGDKALSGSVCEMLDESKQNAVSLCLASDELVVVEGPPGTGKTQFIVGLIRQVLTDAPRARVLLASQTHIAIDNALERLGREWAGTGLLRIAREASRSVAATSEPYLLNAQMQLWQQEVVERGTNGLRDWAESMGVDFSNLRAASLARQLATSSTRSAELRTRVQSEEERKSKLPRLRGEMSPADLQAEGDRIEADLQDLRDQLESEKRQRERLEAELRARRQDAEEILQRTAEGQADWAEGITGSMPHAEVAERVSALQGEWFDRFGSKKGLIRPLVERASVVASTCLGLASVEEATEAEFDLCIIDEASKATAMEACVPMARAKKWVLVGDSKQLPPFQEEILAKPELRDFFEIDQPEAEESAFERMRRLLPDGCRVMLTTQYRMVQPIGRLVSECFYEGKLESVRKNVDPHLCALTKRAVNWFSTRELLHRRDERAGRSFVNPEEASHVCDLLLDLDTHLDDEEVARTRSVLVLSGYSAQVQHLNRRIHQIRSELRHLVPECCTIDRVQGREADVVFFSVTRSNPDNRAGFLRALERINVALSRALDLLVIVGDDEFVQRAPQAEPLQRVLRHIQRWPSECFVGVLEDHDDRRGHRA